METFLKNKVKVRGAFLNFKKCLSTHHVYHAFHHKLTTQIPRFATQFLQNPLQKDQNRLQKKSRTKSAAKSRTANPPTHRLDAEEANT